MSKLVNKLITVYAWVGVGGGGGVVYVQKGGE